MCANWVGLCLCPEIKFEITRHFLENPELHQNQSQLAKGLGIPAISVSRHIRDLVSLRILREERHGKAAVYSLNRKSALVKGFLAPVVTLNSKLIPDWVGKQLKSLPARLKGRINRIILFGSAARDEMGTASDIDLLVILSRESRQLKIELRERLVGGGSTVGFKINLHVEPQSRFDSPSAAAYLREAKTEGVTVWRP